MILVQTHPSFKQWYQIYAFGKLLQEIDSKRKAIREGRKVAKSHEVPYFMFNDDCIET